MRTTWLPGAALLAAALTACATATLPATAASPAMARPDGAAQAGMAAPAPAPSVQCSSRARVAFTWTVCVEVTEGRARGRASYAVPDGVTTRIRAQAVWVEECRPGLTGCRAVAWARGSANELATRPAPTRNGRAYRACGTMTDTDGFTVRDVCSPAVRVDAGRALPAIVLPTPDYDVEVVFVALEDPPTAAMVFRRTDLVGVEPGFPDGYGYDQAVHWGDAAGDHCLTSAGGQFTYPDAAPRAFTYGLAGRGIDSISITGVDGSLTLVPVGPPVGDEGFRAWLTERPLGEIATIEAFADGRRVASIPGGGPSDDFGLSGATCTG